jgi:7-cyano-7-deazaguanine synthase
VSSAAAPAPHRPAVVLLSGGLDSATTLAIAKTEGYLPYALSFRYGQRHAVELDAARMVARQVGAHQHQILDIDLHGFGGSALTDDIPVPLGPPDREIPQRIPVTYVPARNTIFLAFALGWCEVLGGADIFIGVNAIDYSGYPDCRPEFIRAFEALANLGTKAGVEGGRRFQVHAPLIAQSKEGIIRRGIALGVDLGLTRSCYAPDDAGRACGRCDACVIRLRGFAEVGITDPAPYAEAPSSLAP